MLDLSNKCTCLLGLQDSGKSTLAHFIASEYGGAAFVYDTLNEFPEQPFDSYVPKDRESVGELEIVVRRVLSLRKYTLLIIDEANRYCPSKPTPLPSAIRDMNDYRAHYGLGTLYIARRPVQINQDLLDLSNYLIIFHLTGKHDIDYLNDTYTGLGDAVASLAPYYFIVHQPMTGFEVHFPISANFKTNKKLARDGQNLPASVVPP